MRPLERHARDAGPLAAGWTRVVVLEPGGRATVRDFPSAGEAAQYAGDAAWETEDDRGRPLVGVFQGLPDGAGGVHSPPDG